MKKAKVSKGIVRAVWPWMKGDLIKELPPQYRGLNGKPIPDCIVDVPDDVVPGWVWSDVAKAYLKPVKKPVNIGKSDLIDVIAAKLGIDYDDLVKEVMARKKARKHASAKAD